MTSRPSRIVTFLVTDIENSTQLAREHPESWEVARERHHTILRESSEQNNGFEFQIVGDAFCAAFHRAEDRREDLGGYDRRVVRGDSWTATQVVARASYRFYITPDDPHNCRGFRVVVRTPSR